MGYKAKRTYINDQIAQTYETSRFSGILGRFVNKLEKDAVHRSILTLGNAKTILDAPCGTGRLFEVLLESGADLTAADISTSMMKFAHQRTLAHRTASRPSIVLCEIEHLPFCDRVFDYVVCIRFIALVPPEARKPIVGELSRVSNRFLVFSLHNWLCLMGILRKLKGLFSYSKEEWYPQTLGSIRDELQTYGLRLLQSYSVLPYISQTCIVSAEKAN